MNQQDNEAAISTFTYCWPAPSNLCSLLLFIIINRKIFKWRLTINNHNRGILQSLQAYSNNTVSNVKYSIGPWWCVLEWPKLPTTLSIQERYVLRLVSKSELQRTDAVGLITCQMPFTSANQRQNKDGWIKHHTKNKNKYHRTFYLVQYQTKITNLLI